MRSFRRVAAAHDGIVLLLPHPSVILVAGAYNNVVLYTCRRRRRPPPATSEKFNGFTTLLFFFSAAVSPRPTTGVRWCAQVAGRRRRGWWWRRAPTTTSLTMLRRVVEPRDVPYLTLLLLLTEYTMQLLPRYTSTYTLPLLLLPILYCTADKRLVFVLPPSATTALSTAGHSPPVSLLYSSFASVLLNHFSSTFISFQSRKETHLPVPSSAPRSTPLHFVILLIIMRNRKHSTSVWCITLLLRTCDDGDWL